MMAVLFTSGLIKETLSEHDVIMMSSCRYCIGVMASIKVILQLVDKILSTSLLKPNEEDPLSSFLSNSHTCCTLPLQFNSNH